MQQLTVKELAILLAKELKKGNGDKYVVISNDNEGNGFHGLFYGFTPFDNMEDADREYYSDIICDSAENDLDNLIILG